MIVLDTHAWLWLGSNPGRLSRLAAATIADAVRSGGIAIASVTLVEIAWLMAHHRLGLGGTSEVVLSRMVNDSGVVVKEITPAIATLSVTFTDVFPRDPVDRLIAATARAEGLKLVTRDKRMRASGVVETVW